MRTFNDSDPLTNIQLTVQKHPDITPHLLSLHASTGCDSVPAYYRIGKPTAIKICNEGTEPPALGFGDPDIAKATKFMDRCYGATTEESSKPCLMSELICGERKTEHQLPSSLHICHPQQNAFSWKYIELSCKLHFGDKQCYQDRLTWMFLSMDMRRMDIPKKPDDILSCTCSGEEPCKGKHCGCHRMLNVLQLLL